MTPLTASEALMASRMATTITVDPLQCLLFQGEGVLALGVAKSFPLALTRHGPLTLSTTPG